MVTMGTMPIIAAPCMGTMPIVWAPCLWGKVVKPYGTAFAIRARGYSSCS